ncbi:MAG TPA: enoyl-CoA hydratase/isomerase family protein [Kribbella sp.]|nr:enoyl-CoA hydratase/isomerase family protein [Amycolatopsis sp.]HWD77610.1 enoyl-CoA hydratase/isomerase family protein [Kribbella sp.]
MADLDGYRSYTRASLHREEGILQITLHNGHGGSMVWDEAAHRELPDLWAEIAADRENRVVILTGAGADFCADTDVSGWSDMGTPAGWDKIYREAKGLLLNLMDIEAPVIAAINGRVIAHPEIAVLSDIVLASEETRVSDDHFAGGIVPGDGANIVWPMLLGRNRGRYFLLTGQELGAQELLQLGVVNEVLPGERLLGRAWELARHLAERSDLALRYSRVVLTQEIREELVAHLSHSLALEGASAGAAFAALQTHWENR